MTADRYAFGESISAPAVEQRAVVAEERLLDDVLRLGDAAEHPVGDREQQRAQVLVRLGHARVFAADTVAARIDSPRGRERTGCRRARGNPSRQLGQRGLPAELAPRLRVRRAADLASSSRPRRRRREAREPGGDVPRRRRAEALGEVRQPLGDGRRLVVDDVVDARRAALDRGDRRRGGVVDVDERPDAGAVADEREACARGSASATRSPSTCPARRARRSGARGPRAAPSRTARSR